VNIHDHELMILELLVAVISPISLLPCGAAIWVQLQHPEIGTTCANGCWNTL